MRLALLLTTALCAAACTDAGEAPAPPAARAVVPDPDATPMAPEVRELVAERTAAVRAAPDDAAAWRALGEAYDAHHLFHAAAPCYAEAARLDPGSAKAWYHGARALAELARLDEAVAAMGRSIELDPSHAPSWWRRGTWLLDLGRRDEAEPDFRRAAELAPADDAGWLGLARVALERGEPARAAELLEDVLARRPESGYARQLLGTAYRELGREEDAVRELARSQRERPVWFDTWKVEIDRQAVSLLDRLYRLRDEIRAGRAERALPELLELARAHPTDIAVLSTLTPALVQAGELERAAEVNARAAELDPENFRAHLNLGLLLPRLGRTEAGLEHARRAAALSPSLQDAHVQCGRLLLALERPADAARALRRAVEQGDRRPATGELLVRALALAGDGEGARAALADVAPLVRDRGELAELDALVRAAESGVAR